MFEVDLWAWRLRVAGSAGAGGRDEGLGHTRGGRVPERARAPPAPQPRLPRAPSAAQGPRPAGARGLRRGKGDGKPGKPPG